MSGLVLHTVFDVFAWMAAGLAALWLTRVQKIAFPAATTDLPYIAAVVLGAGLGAVLFGTLNMTVSGMPGAGRSIEGAIAGGIVAVELYKYATGLRLRTGARFALPLAVGVAVGRIGCHLAGIEDFTHGTPTTLPWGHDFGDGVLRHPVQLYESAAMTTFALLYVVKVMNRDTAWIDRGFYAAVGFYGAQRFAWEFLKPYGTLVGPFTVFHLLSAALVVWAVVMLATAPEPGDPNDRTVA
ncbi:MAG: prolipoprotein diacylglyceryl transferase [Rhodoplanes sp.]|uniref:prolipoprotein diacylglyceryl transferase n=1 Tax=Rhodoplanes sp. TaxID=1968906 RepID=UPI00184CC541|nr:prolipoprotein diacylglyceryl transferase family protein [Rhodoplanes sp.]NVO16838.1 prolipoprotein diacylglyceryl transferase [Rhodoplanes sp.]